MRRRNGYLVSGAGMAVTMLFFIVGLEAEVATARSGVDPGTVNRELKGDRLPLVPRPSGARPAPRLPEPKLPAGCVSAAGATKNTFATEIPGRCVASAPVRHYRTT